MNRYWENQSGVYDPTATKVIEKENKARNKEVHDTISQIKNILKDKDLVLIKRMVIKDKQTKKVYK